MPDPYKPNAGFAPSGGASPLPGTDIIQELIDGTKRGNRTVIPAPAQVLTPSGTTATPFGLPGQAINPATPRAPIYIPPAVIPAPRLSPGADPIDATTGTKFQKRAPFPLSGIESKAAAGGGTAAFGALNGLLNLTKLPLGTVTPTGTPFIRKLIRGGPGSVVGTSIALGSEAGTGEEARLSIEERGRAVGAVLAANEIQPLTQAEVAALRAQLNNDVAANAVLTGFNVQAEQNTRTLAAGLAVDAARGAVALDLATVAGGAAIARREAFVAGLLGLMLPNDAIGGVVLFNPTPQRGDP